MKLSILGPVQASEMLSHEPPYPLEKRAHFAVPEYLTTLRHAHFSWKMTLYINYQLSRLLVPCLNLSF
jgi:hypothetical protein